MTAALPTPAKHVPERTCAACRRKRPQSEFLRVTRVGGKWDVRAGNRVGRGAYVCADTPECWQEKRLRRAFRAQAAEIAEQLQNHQKDPNQNHSAPDARVSPEVSHV
ncbi:YlxR family protein [Deinococcus marmoris]|uniref:Nucleic-acid-binding protein implicated in transcription termination n=1 Tax=Deinococcus marmoris TaxID=249408 RepID=A0A1U7P3Y5_9DEIO|nr:YlxR family protein [Deinococcus marmoris]OLV19876.1 nucleic-acid-binding protein implicated in transcription termination [Deinococcus marmoris]